MTVTIEKTGKKWKAIKAAGALAFIAGFATAAAGAIEVGCTILLFGIAAYLFGRIGAWWFHG